MTTSTTQIIELNNGVEMPALGLGVFSRARPTRQPPLLGPQSLHRRVALRRADQPKLALPPDPWADRRRSDLRRHPSRGGLGERVSVDPCSPRSPQTRSST